MTHSESNTETLSRSSDHLGNLANILKDLGGGASLLNELIQNANDAKADKVHFTSSATELEVWNSAVFSDCGHQPDRRTCPWVDEGRRSCDLHSFRLVAGRHKSNDNTTTGAFGVGFTAVYQVTDHPELLSGGWHLILDELRSEEQRIRICRGGCSRNHGMSGTTFFLPWARADTDLRRSLGATPLADADIELLMAQMHENASSALVFLEHLESLEVRSDHGHTSVTRSREAERITITANESQTEWLLLEGEAPDAADWRDQYGLAESGRSALVQVAVPTIGTTIGRVFADLPTETRTGWSGHINGTFFPRQDRKSVEFGGRGFRGSWNDLLVDTAAQIAAANLERIADTLGEEVAWNYLVDVERINRDIAKDEYPAPFRAFFARAKLAVPRAAIARLVDDESVTPLGVLVPRDTNEYESADALVKLGLLVLHPSLRPLARQISLTQYGMHLLAVDNVIDALRMAQITEPWTPTLHTELDDDDVEKLLRLIESIQGRGKSLLLEAGADEVAIIPCIDGTFAAAHDVSSLDDDDDRALFELLDPELKVLDRDRLESLCPSMIGFCCDITPARAIEIFESDTDALAVAPDRILEWLANHRSALTAEDLNARVRALPVFPSMSGELLPLTELSLPSDFDDVLGVADVVDRDKTAGFADLLRLLGARELDAVEYLGRHVVPAAQAGDLTVEQAASILEIIHRHRNDMERERATLAALTHAPIVATDQGLKAPTVVHLPNRALSLIDPDAPVATVGCLAGHLVETLVFLGVSRTPNDSVLAAAATRLGQEECAPEREVVLAILHSLPNPPESAEVPTSLRALVNSQWLPVEGGGRARPREAFAVFQRYLFESQGPHLDLPRDDQQRLTKVFEWLGVQSTPTTAMVVAHLRYCSDSRTEVNPQVYRVLGEAKEEQTVRALRDYACVQVTPGEFVDPDVVFWTDPHLGAWTRHLPPTHRQFQAFYHRVGVEESPTPNQIERILRRISRTRENDLLEDGDRSVVHRCWELLDAQLPSSEPALVRLGPIRSALGPRGLLEKPQLLLFADGRRLAESILLIRDNLIHRDRTTQRALSAAGVRAAEEVIEARVDVGLEFVPADEVAALVKDRQTALERLVEAQRTNNSSYDLEILDDLRFDLMPALAVEYVTTFAHQQQVDGPRPTEAIYLREPHRLIVRSPTATRHLARELALCIAPEADVSTMAPSILEILSAEHLVEAMQVLDEYGVRDLTQTSWEYVETPVAADLDETHDAANSASEKPGSARKTPPTTAALPEASNPPDSEEPHLEQAESPTIGSGEQNLRHGGGLPSTDTERRRSRSDKRRVRNTSRLTSYVSFDESARDSDTGDEAARSGSIDRAGVKRVLEHETRSGRVPEEQSHTNPGFDVLSRSTDGVVVRRIEVKSIGGPWTDRGVLLSSTQFEDAQAHQDSYWLYVVEHAEDDDACVVHRIQNPAGQATGFGFDSGWQALDEPEIPRDDSGQPASLSTRQLLSWGVLSGDEV